MAGDRKMASTRQGRLRIAHIGLIAATAATPLSFGLDPMGKQARSETGSTPDEAARRRRAA